MEHSSLIWPSPALLAAQGKVRSMRRYGVCLIAVAGFLLAGPLGAAARPDFSGVWDSYPRQHVPASSPDDLFVQGVTEVFLRPGGEPQLREPYASVYKARVEKSFEVDGRGEPHQDTGTTCLPQGVPAMMSAILPLEILQTRKILVILAESFMEVRRIYLNEKMPPLDDIVPGYYGYSVGRWEGDTLVAETIGIREDVLFLGIPHSSKMKVTERLRLTAPDMMEDRIVMDDPDVLAKPYVFTYRFKKLPNYKLAEFVCENDRYAKDSTILDVRPKN